MPLIEPDTLLRALLVFVRVGGVLVAAPFFGHPSIPVRLRVLLAVLLAYAVVGLVPGGLPFEPGSAVGLLAAVAVEALTGLTLGFAAQFIFYAVQFAGEVLGFQMGLGLAQVFDPVNGASTNPLGRFLVLTLLLVFLLLEGHHLLLRALVASFELVPLAAARLDAPGPLLLEWTGSFFTTALRLAAPFMATIFLVDTALGVFARVAPQADLFSIGLPLKLLIGLTLFTLFLQQFFPLIPSLIDGMFTDLHRLLDALTE